MKAQRKLLTESQIDDFCNSRKGCHGCPLKLRLSSSTYCIKEIPELQKQLAAFLCEEVDLE